MQMMTGIQMAWAEKRHEGHFAVQGRSIVFTLKSGTLFRLSGYTSERQAMCGLEIIRAATRYNTDEKK